MKKITENEGVRDIIKSMGQNNLIREKTILKQIALIEIGASQYLTETSLRDDFGITSDQLARLRESRRKDIDGYKRHFEEGKFRLSSEINERLKLTEAMRIAAMTGDEEAGKGIKNLLKDLETFVPVSLMKEMWEVLEKVNGESVKPNSNQSSTNIQLNIGASMETAERLIAERKKAAIVEVPKIEEENL